MFTTHITKCITRKNQSSMYIQLNLTFPSHCSCIRFHSLIFQLRSSKRCIRAQFKFVSYAIVQVRQSLIIIEILNLKLLCRFVSSKLQFHHWVFRFPHWCSQFRFHSRQCVFCSLRFHLTSFLAFASFIQAHRLLYLSLALLMRDIHWTFAKLNHILNSVHSWVFNFNHSEVYFSTNFAKVDWCDLSNQH